MLAAEEAGAKAAVIINSEDMLMPMGDDQHSAPAIPSIHLPLSAGQALRGALAASSGSLWGTLRPAQIDSTAADPRSTGSADVCPVPGSAHKQGSSSQTDLLERPCMSSCKDSDERLSGQETQGEGVERLAE